MSDAIAKIINEMLMENEGVIEFRRNEIAERINCVPSQINYVITSRFTPEKGYIVESRRGGGGFIKITRVSFDERSYVVHFLNSIGDVIDYETTKIFLVNLYNHGVISAREMKMLAGLTSNTVLKAAITENNADKLRAAILKNAIITIIND